jgi:hypothetical protein
MDKFLICKNLVQTDTITNLEEWSKKCPPQQKIHWKPSRSAMETAKLWLKGIPMEFSNVLNRFNLHIHLCSPEFITKFDNYKGNGRNHDLLIGAKDSDNKNVIISIESKVDESFGKTIGSYLKEIENKKLKGENTNADKRIIDLKNTLLPDLEQKVFESLRYQLLTAVAGTLAEANMQESKVAIMLIQNICTSELNPKKHKQNQKDLNAFINALSNGKHKTIDNGIVLGPFKFFGNEFINHDVDFWIGKYSVII